MIYLEKKFTPVFRVLNKSRDRAKVILFDRKRQAYTQRWLPTHRLTADDHQDLHLLQSEPQRYAPNLEELHHWLTEHPHAAGRGSGTPSLMRIVHSKEDPDGRA